MIGLVGALGGVVGAVKEVLEKNRPMLLGGLKGALGKVLDVVLGVVEKLEAAVNGKENVLKNGKAKDVLKEAQKVLQEAKENLGNGNGKELERAKRELDKLSNKDGTGSLKKMWDELGKLSDSQKSLKDFIDVSHVQHQVDPGKNTINEFIHKVIKRLMDQLALGLQKWVGWQETGDTCCLGQTKKGASEGIGKGCERQSATVDGTSCCRTTSGESCASHECNHCGITPSCNACGAVDGSKKCYLSAYQKNDGNPKTSSKKDYLWPTLSNKAAQVHLLARIFLGSVCLIWSGLSQLGFLTGSGGDKMWKDSNLHEESANLGSFMAAMGYDLERLNQGKGPGEYCLGWSCEQHEKQYVS